jgi:predicted nucleic acid-binding protein
MKMTKAFFDTNVLLYLLSADSVKADRAEALLTCGGVISVQVLNEFTSVALRKLKLSCAEIRDILWVARSTCQVDAITLATHDQALELAERYSFSWYDSLIVSAALIANCRVLYSEDMQHGQIIDSLVITNPFLQLNVRR